MILTGGITPREQMIRMRHFWNKHSCVCFSCHAADANGSPARRVQLEPRTLGPARRGAEKTSLPRALGTTSQRALLGSAQTTGREGSLRSRLKGRVALVSCCGKVPRVKLAWEHLGSALSRWKN